ncbi:MAG TPA: hypothetical protein VF542_18850 [Jatrophihabitans sp.]|jgi:hypothetical protein
MGDETMDVEAVRKQLSIAVSQQLGSLVSMTLLAGSLRGASYVGLKVRLREYAVTEVTDTERLVEMFCALGGELQPLDLLPPPATDSATALKEFIERDKQVMASLHAVISSSGQEPQSEALEHLIEHILLRKQEQLDFLLLAQD